MSANPAQHGSGRDGERRIGTLLWYVFGFAAAGTIAWLVATVHASGRAPVGLTSLVVGTILGATLSGFAGGFGITGTRHLLIGTILFAILTVLAEHFWLYVDYCRQWQQAIDAKPQAALFQQTPPSAAEYFRHELTPASAALWFFDALLIVASTIATVFVLRRQLRLKNDSPQPPTPSP